MLQSLFNKVAGLKVTLLKRDFKTSVSCEFLQMFKSIFFTEHLQWLLLKRVCEGTSLVKILQSCNFNKDAY